MSQHTDSWERALKQFRAYLAVVGQVELDPRLHGKFDLSDVIQETLREAHECKRQLRDLQREQQGKWMRKAFANNLIDEIRKWRAQQRDAGREQSIDDALYQSSARLQDLLNAEESTPSQKFERQERELRVAEALTNLLEPEREAIILQHWHGWTLAQIGERLGRTSGAVAGLLHRGLGKLRKELQDWD